jgi:hypothetical protein
MPARGLIEMAMAKRDGKLDPNEVRTTFGVSGEAAARRVLVFNEHFGVGKKGRR